MRYAIDELKQQLHYNVKLLAKSKLHPSPNGQWRTFQERLQKRVDDLNRAVSILTYFQEKGERDQKIADIYKTLALRDQAGAVP